MFCSSFNDKNTVTTVVFFLLFLCVCVSGVSVASLLVYTSLSVNPEASHAFEHYQEFFNNDLYIYTFVRSLLVIMVSLLSMLALSLCVSRVLLFCSRMTQIFFVALFVMPICLPSLVSVIAIQRVLTLYSFMPQQGGSVDVLMFFGYIYAYFPYVFLLIAPTFLRISRQQVEAARDLGCREWGLWRVVFIPFVSKSLYMAVISVFPFIFFDITIPEVFGGGKSGSFCHFLWSFFLEFQEWRSVSVIAVVCCVGGVCAYLAVKLGAYVQKKP